MKENTRIVTPEFRLAFAALFTARANPANPASVPNYGCTMLFSKTTDVSPLRALMLACAQEKWGEKLKDPNFKLENPIKDGDLKPEWAGYPGSFYVRAVTRIQPAVFDQNCKLISAVEQKRVYGGMYCKAQVHCFAWDNTGKKGVSFGVNAVQIVRDGEPFGGGLDEVNAAKVFGVIAPGKDDPKNYAPAGAVAAVNPFA